LSRAPADLVLGIDEAGRGPIIGPMVMACVALAPRKSASLTRAGVMDSKRFGAGVEAHAARTELVPRILDAASSFEIVVVDVAEVDRRTRLGELNRLEQEHAARMIERAPRVRRIVADGQKLFRPLCARHPHLDALDHGEERHVAVAAASVLAKVRRDELFARIAARYAPDFGEIRGGGYVNEATRAFLRAYIERHRALPPEARRSWPWEFARDLLGRNFDPLADVPDDRPQLSLL
jgi:ribonuclease HII